jgi:hypothetical protein
MAMLNPTQMPVDWTLHSKKIYLSQRYRSKWWDNQWDCNVSTSQKKVTVLPLQDAESHYNNKQGEYNKTLLASKAPALCPQYKFSTQIWMEILKKYIRKSKY